VRRLIVVPFLFAICLAGACGGPSSGGLAGKSASQVLALAKAAEAKEGSFHFVDQTGTGSQGQTLVGDTSFSAGQQQVRGPNGVLEVRLVGKTIFVNASELVLQDALKMSSGLATKFAGKWLSLQPTDAPYQTVAEALLPASEIGPYTPASDLKLGSVTTLRHQNVLPVSGTAPSSSGASATATLYISTTAPYVPVGGSLVATGSDKSESEEVAFTAFGESVKPVAPTGAISYAAITPSS
jgi:hypothetical protein